MLSSPVCAAVLIAVLLLDWLSLPNHRRAVSTLSPRSHVLSTAHGRPVPIELYRTPSGLRAQGTLEPAPIPPAWTLVHGFVLFQDIPRREGLWGLTRERLKLIVLNPSDLTPAEIAILGPVLLEALPASVLQDDPRLDQTVELLTRGTLVMGATPTWNLSRALSWGYIHNAFAAFLMTAALISVPLASRRIFRSFLAHNRRLGGLCISCGYNLQSCPSDVCPECGHHHML